MLAPTSIMCNDATTQMLGSKLPSQSTPVSDHHARALTLSSIDFWCYSRLGIWAALG